jgi:hypothetical protein
MRSPTRLASHFRVIKLDSTMTNDPKTQSENLTPAAVRMRGWKCATANEKGKTEG